MDSIWYVVVIGVAGAGLWGSRWWILRTIYAEFERRTGIDLPALPDEAATGTRTEILADIVGLRDLFADDAEACKSLDAMLAKVAARKDLPR